jgi:hypothetical protein
MPDGKKNETPAPGIDGRGMQEQSVKGEFGPPCAYIVIEVEKVFEA